MRTIINSLLSFKLTFKQLYKKFKINFFDNPWANPENNSNNNNNKNSSNSRSPNNNQDNNKKQNNKNDDFDFEKFINQIFENPKKLIKYILVSLLAIWLGSGVYKVNADENAITLYFGKFYNITTPGLNYHLPYPFGSIIKESISNIKTEEFGFSSNNNKINKKELDAESLMLTGDENIVDIEFQVQWQIEDIRDFTFNVAEGNRTIRKTAESAMREVIARTPIVEALSDGKKKIEDEVKDLLQQILDSYKMGVHIHLVQLRRVDPPLEVIDSFRDVQTAKADKEKEINQAQSYANDIIPRARGEASQIVEDAEAFRKMIVADATGESERFISVYKQYVNAKHITKKRIYLETMEEIYGNNNKIFIDKSASKSVFIPINNNFNNKFTPIPNNISNNNIINKNKDSENN